MEPIVMEAFLDALPQGTFVSIGALRRWLEAGKGPTEGGVLDVTVAQNLSAEERRIWSGSLPAVGVRVANLDHLDQDQG